MFYNGNLYLIIILLTCVENHISSLQATTYRDTDNFHKFLQKRKMNNNYNFNRKIFDLMDYKKIPDNKVSLLQNDNIINKFSFIGDELFNSYQQNPDDITDIEESEYPLDNFNNSPGIKDIQNKDNENREMLDNVFIKRRETPSDSYIRNIQNSSLYPSVLTKSLEISLNPSSPFNSQGNLLANVAQKLNTSTLDLAEQLINSETPQSNDKFGTMIQNYLKNKAVTCNQPLTLNNPTQNQNLQSEDYQLFLNNQHRLDDVTTSSLKEILEHVLEKLENIQEIKNKDKENLPEGAPCDIIGQWSSITLGLCFDIQLANVKMHDISPAEINNKMLAINAVECIPAKQHHVIDLDWKFTGSALKQWGGPFYVYGQKRNENTVATFVGFCRICGGIDTIFGSWNFLLPSKDCNDISLGFEVKRDILRRLSLEKKRKERFKNLLYQSRLGKT